MTRLIPTEHELHAYIDERLTPERGRKWRPGWQPTRRKRRGIGAWRMMLGACGRPCGVCRAPC
jgi:hypothetical protein